MKKIIIVALSAIFLVACSQEETTQTVDQTSSATGVWDKGSMSDADKQFANLRNEGSGQESSETVRTVRPEVSKFIIDQYKQDSIQDREIKGLTYYINNKAMTTAFMDKANHSVKGVGYDYNIEIQALDQDVSQEQFIQDFGQGQSEVEMKGVGEVFVSNLNGNSYASQFTGMYKKDSSTYIIKISSPYMSVPEILTFAEEFYKYLA